MSNLIILGKALNSLPLLFIQDGEWLRVHCPFNHVKTPSRPSGVFNLKTTGYYCHCCKRKYKTVQLFLEDLEFEKTIKNNPTPYPKGTPL
jgi:hypothetical protein